MPIAADIRQNLSAATSHKTFNHGKPWGHAQSEAIVVNSIPWNCPKSNLWVSPRSLPVGDPVVAKNESPSNGKKAAFVSSEIEMACVPMQPPKATKSNDEYNPEDEPKVSQSASPPQLFCPGDVDTDRSVSLLVRVRFVKIGHQYLRATRFSKLRTW
ncbi:MAG: hypothetical protein SGI77_13785 [Pirellulaceae bacterium]|nr:hypothetical protein [Pirellulaceae bacterium]